MDKKLKIAVYTISKNEEAFVDRWLSSCSDADFIMMADTGSTDGSVKKLVTAASAMGITHKCFFSSISISPWRFDDARNASLALIPDDIDICICLDMDEILVDGWREIVEQTFKQHPSTTRLRYPYVWNWIEGKPGVTYHADKIHTRHGYRWKSPVHEVLVRDRRCSEEVQTFIHTCLIEHHADSSKPRSQYLPLMELAVKEDPNDDRMAHYYARELYYYDRYAESFTQFQRHLSLNPGFLAEVASSHRYMGDCAWAMGMSDVAITCFLNANDVVETREGHVKLAQAFRMLGDWEQCRLSCLRALEFTERSSSHINDPVAWSEWPNIMLRESERNLFKPEE